MMEPHANQNKHKPTKKGQDAGWQTVATRKKISPKGSPQLSPSVTPADNLHSMVSAPRPQRNGSQPAIGPDGNKEWKSPSTLQDVVKHIHAKKWKPVFRDLMATSCGEESVDVMIGDIEKNHQGDVAEMKYQALRKWISEMGSAATSEKLKQTFEKNACPWPYGEDGSLVVSASGTAQKSEQKQTGARPKERKQRSPVQLCWDGQQLFVHRGTDTKIVPLQGRLDEDETQDPIVITDAMLVSIINPNHSDNSYLMGLNEVKERFHEKYGKSLSFKDLSVGRMESFVKGKSRCLKLIQHEGEKSVLHNQTRVGKTMSSSESSDSDSDTESEMGNFEYETASEMSSACPSPPAQFPKEEIHSHWQMPKKSPRALKVKQLSKTGEQTLERKYCPSVSEDELRSLLEKCEGRHLIVRTEEEYQGEYGRVVFTRDVVALWNTPRKGNDDAYIVVGVKPATSPPHDCQGLKQTGKLNEDYQEMFMEQSFSYKPPFSYSEVQYSNKMLGTVRIVNGKGYGNACYAEDTNGEWSQSDILYRDGNKFTSATRKEQGHIYSWFNKTKVSSMQKDGADSNWKTFMDLMDVDNHQRRSYCLLVSRCPSEYSDLSALGNFPWVKIWDFDPDSRESGLLSKCEAEIQDQVSIRTWKDPVQISFSNSCREWLFVRGLRNIEESLVLGTVKEWGKMVGASLNAHCDQINRICETKPLTVVVLWYGSMDCLRHLHKALGKIDECPSGIKYIICMHQTPGDEDSQGVVRELCRQLEIPKVIEIPLERLCFEMSKLLCCQKPSAKRHELPGDTILKSRDSEWLQQELDVLFKGDFQTDERPNQGEVFLKGGNLTWPEIELGVYDAERFIASKLTASLQKRLHNGLSGIVTLFHEPGAGGTTLARRTLWDLHEQFPCACTISDVIDPCAIYYRLEKLYESTHLPILLLVDGQELRLVKELFEMSQNIHLIMLNVQRYRVQIGNKVSKGDRFWLRGEVDKKEAIRFSQVFSQKCSGERRQMLDQMVEEVVAENASHYVYEFGLTVYDKKYIGLRSYVSGYLNLNSGGLASWQRAVGYLALAFYYGHISIPCQFFSILFDKEESEVLKADDVMTHSGKQFVLEDVRNCTWRITHHAVAQEILEQILCGRRKDNKDLGLSIDARRNLKEFAKEFLTYASKKQQKLKFDSSSAFMRIVRGIFIHRDYKDTGQDEYHKRDRLSRLLCDLPCSKTSTHQLDVMEHLVSCFPEDPTCIMHLGRAHIITQNFDLAEKHLVKAKDLRKRERRANQDKYDTSRLSGDKGKEDTRDSDSILCTIHHTLGYLSHERVQKLIGGKHGNKYRCTLDETGDILGQVIKHARTAVNHFTNCRHFRSQGMDASYGYIGEIKMRLHVADFVEKCYKKGGYYGFLSREQNESGLTDFVESCFTCVESLLREYEDLMPPTGQAEIEELDSCLNLFHAIFHDPDTALKFWQGKEGVDSNRSKIAVYKLKHQRHHLKASAHTTPSQVLKCITAEDMPKVIQLYEGIFHDAYMRSINTDLSNDLKDWMLAIRFSQQSDIYSIAGKVLPQVEKCWDVSHSSAMVLYYMYTLNTTLALVTQQTKYVVESNRLREKLKKMHSKLGRLHRKYAWEWLGANKEDHSIRRLVHRSFLGDWDSEKRFWKDEKAHEKLEVCTGIIRNCKMPLHGHIGITTGGLKVGHHSGSLQAVFVPKQYELFGRNYLNAEVEFYIGFNIENGIEAYNVLELKKYTCKHCKVTVSVSKLTKPPTKTCHRCGHAIQVPKDSK
ncbi:uncharacterized protein LOC110986939 isoform X2 [Acanthaster planci]|uniref:Uncharacterized protein LOC110986939 isoform X2 n=1 Tax=Acanthaster planci TaxID=133434 RepID=A0A8B7ZNM1_ACAPL|nr:uncharacterized protein LOC110986939 isoform X2 [Acanthaster planci]